MGYERKRGKLAELNALLRGGSAGRFSLIVGDTAILPDVKYVITLDTDTQLPRDAARAARRAHGAPAKSARGIDAGGSVSAGLQHPAAARGVSLPSAGRAPGSSGCSRASRASTLTRARSPTCIRIFSGRARSSARAFTTSMPSSGASRPLSGKPDPEPRSAGGVLCPLGLVSDVKLYEEYPSRYTVDVGRRHRWIRGDWQIARGSCRGFRVRTRGAWNESALAAVALEDSRQPAPQPGPGRADAAACCWLDVALAAGWFWTLAVLGDRPGSLRCWHPLARLFRKPTDLPLAMHLRPTAGRAAPALGQAGFTLACPALRGLLQPAMPSCARCTRMLLTHRRLLEWTDLERRRAHGAHRSRRFFRPCGSPPCSAAPRCSDLAHLRPAHCHRLPLPGAVVRSPGPRLVDQPPTRRGARKLAVRSAASSAQILARKTWRSSRPSSARGSLAAAGQFPGASRRRGRASHLAHQHRAGAAGQSGGPRFRLLSIGTLARAHRQDAATR